MILAHQSTQRQRFGVENRTRFSHMVVPFDRSEEEEERRMRRRPHQGTAGRPLPATLMTPGGNRAAPLLCNLATLAATGTQVTCTAILPGNSDQSRALAGQRRSREANLAESIRPCYHQSGRHGTGSLARRLGKLGDGEGQGGDAHAVADGGWDAGVIEPRGEPRERGSMEGIARAGRALEDSQGGAQSMEEIKERN
jgi:hypothetical protein